MGEIIRNGLEKPDFIDKRTKNYEQLKKTVLQKRYEPEVAGQLCGVSAESIRTTASWIGTAQRCTILYAMGIVQHVTGVDNVRSIANLMMLTGNIGRPGTGVNALRGQNNVQGACDVGCLPTHYPGYLPVTDSVAHQNLAAKWGFKHGICEMRDGYDITTLFERLNTGSHEIRAMYLIGENPVISDPEPAMVKGGIGNLDFLVVQDIFFTETCQFADVVLPAACWAEKDGTQTNTERRVQRIRQAVPPPGEAKSDWEILADLAGRMGYAEQFRYQSAEEVFAEICSTVPQYQGMSWDRVSRPEGVQWPCPDADHLGTPILYTDSFSTPDGLGVFLPVEWKEPRDMPDSRFPFRLTTGRIIWHWQSGTMTRRCKNLTDEVNEGYLEMNPQDAQALLIRDTDLIRVFFRKGSLVCRARLVRDIKKGTTFMPFHFYESAVAGQKKDIPLFGRMHEYKHTPVRIERFTGDDQ